MVTSVCQKLRIMFLPNCNKLRSYHKSKDGCRFKYLLCIKIILRQKNKTQHIFMLPTSQTFASRHVT